MTVRDALRFNYALAEAAGVKDVGSQLPPLHPSQQMLSSSVGAMTVAVFTTPFEVVKVRLQAQLQPSALQCPTNGQVMDASCVCAHRPAFNSPVVCTIYGNIQTVPRFSSTLDAFKKIASREGIHNLWKGLSPTLVQMVPQTVIYLTLYDQIKMKVGYVEGENNTYSSIFSGVTARTLAVLTVSPLEMIRTKFQSRYNLTYRELNSMVFHTIKSDGVFSLWRGVGPTLLRDTPFSALLWLGYEYLKLIGDRNFVNDFLWAALTGTVASILTQPFDVVKTHRQMELGEIYNREVLKKIPTTFSTMRTLYRTQGLTSLYTGLYPRLLKVAPSCAIMISTYEYGKRYFKRRNQVQFDHG